MLGSIAFLGALYLAALFFQDGLGLSALQSGLTVFPQALGVMAGSQVVTRVLYPRFGPRRIMVGGLLIVTGMLVLMAQVTADADPPCWRPSAPPGRQPATSPPNLAAYRGGFLAAAAGEWRRKPRSRRPPRRGELSRRPPLRPARLPPAKTGGAGQQSPSSRLGSTLVRLWVVPRISPAPRPPQLFISRAARMWTMDH